ncbi:hypothetical protein, partial [Klebsiella aerogenes]|uniref:hypothetical protein n=1 Tax=Klebsiella aerogenes TaxID=548 RepID=UPI0013D6C63A
LAVVALRWRHIADAHVFDAGEVWAQCVGPGLLLGGRLQSGCPQSFQRYAVVCITSTADDVAG